MPSEKELQISPIVPESVMHNSRTLSNLQSLTASILGAAAGILGLESYAGFLFYLAFTVATTLLFFALRVAPASFSSSSSKPTTSSSSSSSSSSPPSSSSSSKSPLDVSRYFRSPWEFWAGGLFGGLPGYILTWTLFYGLVRA